MTRFHCHAGQVYLDHTRLAPEVVRGLILLFNRERAWALLDDIGAAADEAGVFLELEVA
jgi:hypothetical protein